MATRGPWDLPDPPPQPKAPAPRPSVSLRSPGMRLLALIAGLGLLVFVLAKLFPGQVSDKDDWGGIVGGLGMALLIGARLLSGRLGGRGAVRHLAIWAAVVVVLILGYSFRDDLMGLFQRVRSELVPSYPVQASAGLSTMSLEPVSTRKRTGWPLTWPMTTKPPSRSRAITMSPPEAWTG